MAFCDVCDRDLLACGECGCSRSDHGPTGCACGQCLAFDEQGAREVETFWVEVSPATLYHPAESVPAGCAFCQPGGVE